MPRAKSTKSSTPRYGSQSPTVRIAPEYKVTELRAVKLLKAGGLLLDQWQSDILDDWMAMNPGHKWICKTCGISVPRQNGKTGLLEGRAEAGMLLYSERVIYTAHLQKTATESFELTMKVWTPDSDFARSFMSGPTLLYIFLNTSLCISILFRSSR